MARIHAKLEPNNVYRHELDYNHPLTFKIYKPVAGELTDVVIEIYEQDRFPKKTSGKLEQGRGSKDDLIATFKGTINRGHFKLGTAASDVDLEPIDPSDDLSYPPSVAFAFEGFPTRFRLVLNKNQKDEFERNDWDLKIKLEAKTKKRKRKVTFESRHETLVKGNNTVYLYDTKENGNGDDAKAVIAQSPAPYPGYYRMLKRHMTILGFYRFDAHFTTKKHDFNWFRYSRGNDVSTLNLKDEWDEELKWAIKQFHDAASQPWRIDGTSGRFVELGKKALTFDKSDGATKKEVDAGKFGDKSKEELIRWLGSNFHKVDGGSVKPKYRSPYIFSLVNLIKSYDGAQYGGSVAAYDEKSGRLINKRVQQEDRKTLLSSPDFVCTTSVNFVFSNVMALGSKFSYSANAPLVDAIMGLRQESGRRSTPRYYNEYYNAGMIEPCFLLPWLHPSMPASDRKKATLDLLRLHKFVHPMTRVPVRAFNVTFQVANFDARERRFVLKYNPRLLRTRLLKGKKFTRRPNRTGLTLHLQDGSVWNPRAWAPTHPLRFERKKLKNGTREVHVTLDENEDTTRLESGELLASYRAQDRFCEIVGRHHKAAYNAGYSCKCGLHKSYQELADGHASLKHWNLATMGVSSSSLEYSTLTIHKNDKNELLYFHSDKAHLPLSDDADGFHTAGRGEVYYLVFGFANDDDLIRRKINPTIYYERP